MIKINDYIVEKLRINKNTKTSINKDHLVMEISYQVKHCLEDDYNTSYYISFVDERKFITKNPQDTWYVNVRVNTINEKLTDNITNSLKIRLKDIIDEENIHKDKIDNGAYVYKIFLYDPE